MNIETLLLGLLAHGGHAGLPGWAEVDAEVRQRVAAIEMDRKMDALLKSLSVQREMWLLYGVDEPTVFGGLDAWSIEA